MALHNIRRKGAAAAAVIGLGALARRAALVTGAERRATGAAAAAGAPLSVAANRISARSSGRSPSTARCRRRCSANLRLRSHRHHRELRRDGARRLRSGAGRAAGELRAAGGVRPRRWRTRASCRTAYPQEVVTREAAPRVVSYQPAAGAGRRPAAEALREEERDHHRVVRGRRRRHRRGGRRQEGGGHRRAHRRRRRGALGPDHQAQVGGGQLPAPRASSWFERRRGNLPGAAFCVLLSCREASCSR